jgi:hypothetical protein
MMPAGYWSVELRQGETFRREISWTVRDALTGAETLVDTTGAEATMQIRRTTADATVLLELSTANGRITTGGSPHNIILDVPAADTALLAWPEAEQAAYDLFVLFEPPATCLLAGPATLRHAVTRAAAAG